MFPHVQLPGFITSWFPKAIWNIKSNKKVVYLTFDDGPIPEVTPCVLNLLEQDNIPATFFCVGENVKKHTEIYYQILKKGHAVGNHTYNHIKGFKSKNIEYYRNIDKAGEFINSNLFRPPYGLFTKQQYKFLSLKYKIIMWDIISYDYDQKLSGEDVVQNVMKNVRPGSIITFHDSIKAEKNLCYALPHIIRLLKEQGYDFRKIEY